MPRTNSRKRHHRNDNTVRAQISSNLSATAPEFIPIVNNEHTSNQRDHSAIQPMSFCGSSSMSNSSGNDSNSNNSEATNIISSIPDALTNKGQRDLLINLLNNSKVDCVICYERTKNVEPIWNCRKCFQIMHLKCIMVWFIKSHTNSIWRCPACQNELIGKPNYLCFCGDMPNPFSNNVDIPHSCGQICGLKKKNSNVHYNDCQHTCTLLCHPGPCPQCVVQVLRKCGCGKTNVYVHCGQSAPVLCQNICSKELNCKNHVCEKQCHADKCEPCKNNCLQSIENNDQEQLQLNYPLSYLLQHSGIISNSTNSAVVSDEELRMLGLNPEELNQPRFDLNDDDNDDDDDDDDEDDDDDDDDEDEDDDDDLFMNANFYGESSSNSSSSISISNTNYINRFRYHNVENDNDEEAESYSSTAIWSDDEVSFNFVHPTRPPLFTFNGTVAQLYAAREADNNLFQESMSNTSVSVSNEDDDNDHIESNTAAEESNAASSTNGDFNEEEQHMINNIYDGLAMDIDDNVRDLWEIDNFFYGDDDSISIDSSSESSGLSNILPDSSSESSSSSSSSSSSNSFF